jgi:hypothetical protein
MMPRVRIAAAVLLLSVLCGLPIPTYARLPFAGRAHDEFGFVGTLVKVDLARNKLTLKYKEQSKEETVALFLTPKSEILDKDKKKIARSALKTGVTAVVRAYGDDDAPELEVLSIRIVPPLGK